MQAALEEERKDTVGKPFSWGKGGEEGGRGGGSQKEKEGFASNHRKDDSEKKPRG